MDLELCRPIQTYIKNSRFKYYQRGNDCSISNAQIGMDKRIRITVKKLREVSRAISLLNLIMYNAHKSHSC